MLLQLYLDSGDLNNKFGEKEKNGYYDFNALPNVWVNIKDLLGIIQSIKNKYPF